MTFAEARALFPVLETVAYLNAGTFGPLARPVADALSAGISRDLTDGRVGKEYFEETLALRDETRAENAAPPSQRQSWRGPPPALAQAPRATNNAIAASVFICHLII